MKGLKKILVFLFIVFVGIQFIPTSHNRSAKIFEKDIVTTFDVPQNIQALLKKSCYDCHSSNTNYPWYNKIQPISWFLEKHIKEGEKELNFSEFDSYSTRKQKSKLKSITSQVRDYKMPLKSYTLLHRNAKLSENEKKELIAWTTKLRDSM